MRVRNAINHQQTDRIPVDMGATAVTGIAAGALDRLRKALHLQEKKVKVHEPFQILGMVEEDVRKAIGVDIVGLWAPTTFFNYRNEAWKPWKLFDGTDVLVGRGFTVKEDEKGDLLIYPAGDTTVPPSARLPKGGFYFDNITRQEPVDVNHLQGRKDFEEQFTLFKDEDLRYYQEAVDDLYTNTEYSIIGNFGGAGIGDVAYLPGPGLKKTPGIRKVDEWYMAHVLYPEYIKEVYDFQIEIALKNLQMYKEVVGDKIDVIFVSGTDFGTQRSEFMSPDMFREFYKPRFKKINDWIHQNTSWKTFYHSCGSIVRLLDDFVDMGVDILNPVQCSANGMDPVFLKEKYGDKLVFWGGGVDTQKTLPFGTPDQVKQEVLQRLEIFAKGGGYIFNAIHNIQAPTPVENILAMFEALEEYNKRAENA